ncbi:cache domain-containing protein [Pseudomonas viridiflava]|uniref:cache domain-containing protein n=1 Tax=Pseudomonas viridiflava TaxID=33069 RepID=UPI003BF976A8
MSGVVGGDLSLETLVKMISSLRLHNDGYAFLVDANGRILVHPDASLAMKTLAEVYPVSTPGLSQELSESEFAGKNQILTFAHVNGLPSVDWYVGVAMQKQSVCCAERVPKLGNRGHGHRCGADHRSSRDAAECADAPAEPDGPCHA